MKRRKEYLVAGYLRCETVVFISRESACVLRQNINEAMRVAKREDRP